MGNLKRIVLVSLALSVVSAGCVSFTEADPVNTNDSETTTLSASGTPTGGDTSGPHFLKTHGSELREAENATITNTYIEKRNPANRDSYWVIANSTYRAQIDFDSGRAVKRHDPHEPDSYAVYRNESGVTYTNNPDGQYYVSGSGVNIDEIVDVTQANPAAVERQGRGTVDGVTGTVYVLQSWDGLEENVTRLVSAKKVQSFNVTYVVDDAGYVVYERYNLTVQSGDGRTRVFATMRINNVGTTEVESPEWFTEEEGGRESSG